MKNKHKLLIVDDAAENIDILISLLTADYKIGVARDGQRALATAGKTLPDLILLDIMMPGMDGYEVCRRLKANERTKDIPVIFITALSEPMDEAKAFSLGAVDYITKPFTPVTVKARVNTHISLKEKTDMLERMVSLDGLTGIYNRRKFDEILAKEWNRAARYEDPVALVMMDIDYFKTFNDRYGHAGGDECLKAIADCMNNCIERPGDRLCRYGGEEFAAVLPGTGIEGALRVAEKMRAAVYGLGIPHEASLVDSRVTISAGAASAIPGSPGQTPAHLLGLSDEMLYKSKGEGRNRISGAEG
ncbi:MAG: diguanylate cyclase [Desulfobacter sp.]|nr:MAG: diguanylate cyclase [Desulfobacter sp.]